MTEANLAPAAKAPARLQAVRGMNDVLPDEAALWERFEGAVRRVLDLYGYRNVRAPVVEPTPLFVRAIGAATDVVEKEMYTFEDKLSGESLTLRPEATAGIVRAAIEHNLCYERGQRVWLTGPMFRHERPQKGRYRQFHQIDIEVMGAAEPLADAEVIACGWHVLQELGVADGTVLEINTLGDQASRAAYRAALVDYFTTHRDRLSEDSRHRLERNPLRILDSKDEGDRRLVADAPTIFGHLTPEAAGFFDGVLRHLDRFGVPYRKNPRIVRGLDYYSHTAFEFVTDRLGAQGTVMAGGRYDGLVEEMGGPPTPSVGWAAGVERLGLLLPQAPAAPRPVAVVPVGEAAEGPALDLLQALRRAGVVAEIGYRGNLKRRMERANRLHARVALILGEDEIARGVVQLRDLDAGTQDEVPVGEVARRLA